MANPGSSDTSKILVVGEPEIVAVVASTEAAKAAGLDSANSPGAFCVEDSTLTVDPSSITKGPFTQRMRGAAATPACQLSAGTRIVPPGALFPASGNRALAISSLKSAGFDAKNRLVLVVLGVIIAGIGSGGFQVSQRMYPGTNRIKKAIINATMTVILRILILVPRILIGL